MTMPGSGYVCRVYESLAESAARTARPRRPTRKILAQPDRRLCLSRGLAVLISAVGLAWLVAFLVWGWCAGRVAAVADKTGRGRSGGGQALMKSRAAGSSDGPGTAGESFEGQQVR